jgi:hypothetical protein
MSLVEVSSLLLSESDSNSDEVADVRAEEEGEVGGDGEPRESRESRELRERSLLAECLSCLSFCS